MGNSEIVVIAGIQHLVSDPPLHPNKSTFATSSPSNPQRSPDVRIMQAWIDAEMAHPGDRLAIMAAVETAIQRAYEGAGRAVLGRYYYRVPEPIRPLIGLPDGGGLKQLLGRWDKGGFVPGLADLTEREAESYWYRIRGWSSTAIACELTPAKQRFDRRLWVRTKTVYNHCWQAKAKVLKAFGLDQDSEEGEEW